MADDALTRLDRHLDEMEKLLKIDKYAIDDANADHSALLYEVGKKQADAISYRDEAKADFDGVKAKLHLKVRYAYLEQGEKLGRGGITETMIDSQVVVEPEYQRALTRYAEWSDRVIRWDKLWESMRARGYALGNLSSLATSSYWADRQASAAPREVRSQHAEQARERVGAASMEKQRRRLHEDAA